jgi:hypothetical protein
VSGTAVARSCPCEIKEGVVLSTGKPDGIPVRDGKGRGRVYVEGRGGCPFYTPEVGWKSERRRRAVSSKGALPKAATLNLNKDAPCLNKLRKT